MRNISTNIVRAVWLLLTIAFIAVVSPCHSLAFGDTSFVGEVEGRSGDVSVSVSADSSAALPSDSDIRVVELEPDSSEYLEYKNRLLDALGENAPRCMVEARFLDIGIVSGESEVEPASPVNVEITFDENPNTLAIAHLPDDKDASLVSSEMDGNTVKFSADSFSVYALYHYIDFGMTTDLDGLSAIIANANPANDYAALITSATRSPGLASLKGYIRFHRVAFEDGGLNPEVWTFHAITEPDPSIGVTQSVFDNSANAGILYTISADINGETKYMQIGPSKLTLSDTPKPVRVIAGTGEYAGQVQIRPAKGTSNDSYRLNLKSGDVTKYFQGSNYQGEAGVNQNDWMTLYRAEDAEIIAENEQNFANKISVSNIADGAEVVIYHSAWDASTQQYVQLAINGEGDLVLLTDEGGTVGWYTECDAVTNNVISSVKWRFILGYNEDGTPSGYYWLQNTDTGAYLSPRGLYDFDGNKLYDIILPGEDASGNPIVAGTPASFDYSIQLPGRSDGEFASSIVAWNRFDGTMGLRLMPDANTIYGQSLTKSLYGDADYFNFATVMESGHDMLTKATLDSTAKGVEIKMFNYPSRTYMSNIIGSDELSRYNSEEVYTWFIPNLMERTLDANGMPVSAINGQSMDGLFGDDIATPANHLFLESVYNETGYFEYNSAQEYAYFNYDAEHTVEGGTTGNFTVYNQLGAPAGNNSINRSHGHFMPYSKILDEVWTEKNTVDMYRRELPIDDPRYGEDVHQIERNAKLPSGYDYAFGMTVETTFTQTLAKHDAFGNDSILEFTGDDDLWVFIDGVLVLDLGGIHSAVSGKINFTTGEITYAGFIPKEPTGVLDEKGNMTFRTVTDMPTTIKECFRLAGVLPDGTPWDEQKAAVQFDGNTLASSYRGHTMKMFYMERGANASNIHTRFNLRAIRSDAVLVGKEVSGTRKQGYMNQSFAFQAFKSDGTPLVSAEKAVQSHTGEWIGLEQPVQFSTLDVNGTTYDNVFFLGHGEGAYFNLEDNDSYYVKEISIDPSEIGTVRVNNEAATSSSYPLITQNAGDQALIDVQSPTDTAANRREITFDNEVTSQSLEINKKLNLLPGQTPDANLTFQFRVMIGADESSLTNYSVMPYYVKHTVNGQEKYCFRVDGKIVDLDQRQDGTYYYTSNGTEITIPHRDATDPVFDYSSQTGYIDYVPAGYTVEIKGMLPNMAFSVEETSIPQGYELQSISDAAPTSFTPVASQTTNAIAGMIIPGVDAKVDVVNRYSEGTFRLLKVSSEDASETLEGAEFTLYNEPPEYVDGRIRFHSYDAVATFVSDANGFLRVTGEGYYGADLGSADLTLAGGTYYLEETKAPDGYRLANPVSSFWIDYAGDLHINGLVVWDASSNQFVFANRDNLAIGQDTEIDSVVLQTGMISNVPFDSFIPVGVFSPLSGPAIFWCFGFLFALLAMSFFFYRARIHSS